MAFFRKEHKEMAKKNTTEYLSKKYQQSERRLINCANNGDLKGLKKQMKEHSRYEYALLYQCLPGFTRKKK